MGDDNEPIEGSPVDTAVSIAAPAPSYGHGLTTTFTTTFTITNMMSSEATSVTAKPISTPVVKLSKKWVRANIVKKDPLAASTGSKLPIKKI